MPTHVPVKTGVTNEIENNCTSIFRNIMYLKHELNDLGRNVASSLDLRTSEMGIIDTLGTYGPLKMSELAATCFFSPPNATYTVRTLEKRKLLTRTRSVDSNRVVMVELTAAGKKIFKKSFPMMINTVDEFLNSSLNKKERATLELLLKKLEK